jgi:hypothetical protein
VATEATFPLSRSTGELNSKALSHEVRSVYAFRVSKGARHDVAGDVRRSASRGVGCCYIRKAIIRRHQLLAIELAKSFPWGLLQSRPKWFGVKKKGRLTRNNVSGIHRVLVFDEAEAIHQLDLGDLPGAMSRKMSLDVGLGSCRESESVGIQRGEESLGYGPLRGRLPR